MTSDERDTEGKPPGNVRSSPQRRRDRRQAIFQAAWRRFSERPYDDVTLEQIATDAGVTRSTLIGLVGHKEPLYRRCFEKAVDEFEVELDGATQGKGPEQRLRTALSAFVTFADERPDAWSFIERHILSAGRFGEDAERMRERLGVAIARAVSHQAPNRSTDAAAGAMLGAVRATANWRRRQNPDLKREDLIEQLVGITWRGLSDMFEDNDSAPS